MTGTATLGSVVCYSGRATSANWEGRHVADADQFRRFVREVVRPRVADSGSSFASDLRGLATTGMATEFVKRLLTAVPDSEGWEVGEALAECALQQDSGREVHWPWNTVRDRRTPRASLPGTDLVGFYREDDSVLLLFGEVKTSSDANTPPNVMNGGSGMAWQLEQSATRLDIQRALLQWLHARCQSQPYRDLYEKAVGRYLKSEGKELLLVGILIRDTAPSELDLKSRGQALSTKLGKPTRIELIAWYLPVPITEWPKLLKEDAS
ncbi:MAG: hypothetical protein AABY87_10120 [bacterium]